MQTSAEVICHSRKHFEAAFDVAREQARWVTILVRTAPGAAAYAGALYLWSAAQSAKQSPSEPKFVVVDCEDDPSLVLAALRGGWINFAFKGCPTTHKKVCQIVHQNGGSIIQIDQNPVLDLINIPAPAEHLRAWLETLDSGTLKIKEKN